MPERDHSVTGARDRERLPIEIIDRGQFSTRPQKFDSGDPRSTARWWANHPSVLRQVLQESVVANYLSMAADLGDLFREMAQAPDAESAWEIMDGPHGLFAAAELVLDDISRPMCACGSPAVGWWRRRGYRLPVCRTHWTPSGRKLAERAFLNWLSEENPSAEHFAEEWHFKCVEAVADAATGSDPSFTWMEVVQKPYQQLCSQHQRTAAARVGKRYQAGPPRNDDAAQVDKAIELISQGWSLNKAARSPDVRMSPATLYRRLVERRDKKRCS